MTIQEFATMLDDYTGGPYCLQRMQAFRHLECRWLKGVEEHLRKGGTVFDAPER